MERLDLTDLRPEDAKLVKEFFEFLKSRPAPPDTVTDDVEYHEWPLGVKRPITRKEIYDHL